MMCNTSVLGIGCDIVSVKRVKSWDKVFSPEEIDFCGDHMPGLAARFAAKEAFFKALSSALIKLNLTKNEFSFLFLCKYVQVKSGFWEVPFLDVNWSAIEEKINAKLPVLNVELSMSHEKEFAMATVVIERV